MDEKKAEELEEVIYQICRVCGKSKPLNEFYKDKGCKLDRKSICKECDIARAKQYRLDNKEQLAEQRRRYDLKHKEQIAERARKLYLKHRIQILECKKEYNLAHPEQRAEYRRRYNIKHKEQIARQQKESRQTDNGRFLGRCQQHRRRARERASNAGLTPDQWARILKNQKHRCNLCGKQFAKRRKPTVDHIIPLSKGGDLISNNVQALCKSCNCSKNAKIPLSCIQAYLPK